MKSSFFSRLPWRILGIAMVALLSGHWAAIGLAGEHLFVAWWPALHHYQFLVSLLMLGLFMTSSLMLYHGRQAFTMARSLSRHHCEPHAVVILLVSTPNIVPTPDTPRLPLHLQDTNGVSLVLPGTSLAADIEALNKVRWNWQQLLRALQPHTVFPQLKRVYLIGSPGPGGSFAHLQLCQTLLDSYVPAAEVVQVTEPIDFEDFNALVQGMRRIIRQEKDQGRHEHDIIIDVTGGVKTASIAGASITFNSQVKFQYVQTFSPYDVYAYDVIYHSHLAFEE